MIGPLVLQLCSSHTLPDEGAAGVFACLGRVVQFIVLSAASREASGAQRPLLHAQGQLCSMQEATAPGSSCVRAGKGLC